MRGVPEEIINITEKYSYAPSGFSIKIQHMYRTRCCMCYYQNRGRLDLLLSQVQCTRVCLSTRTITASLTEGNRSVKRTEDTGDRSLGLAH
jgi:hypothetical protein